MLLSVVIITHNEEANLACTLTSVQALVSDSKGEIVIVDSGSTDRTIEIAESFGAKVLNEPWRGYAAQKNFAIDNAQGDWILSLDADEELEKGIPAEVVGILCSPEKYNDRKLEALVGARPNDSLDTIEAVMALKESPGRNSSQEVERGLADLTGYFIPRKNFFLGRWIRHGGFWPDPKLRLFRRGSARFEDRLVHEDAKLKNGTAGHLQGAILHHSYPTLSDYIEHINRYSTLGAEMAVARGRTRFSVVDIVFRPLLTFLYNYILRLGFLDGREGLLLHLNHALYVSWKYAKAWELARARQSLPR